MSFFSVHADTGDVEGVLHAVAEGLRHWEGGEAISLDLSFVRRREEQLVQQARQLRLQANLDGNAIIHSTRPKIGPWVIRFQHLVRRLTWWFFEPILQQVRAFQLNTARVVEGLAEEQEALMAEVQRLAQSGGSEHEAKLRSQIESQRGEHGG
ncbi:MAG: hypothetical protein GYA30_11195 [Chloroflexi bacterium]|nr:hypothetical protein [Chloroflexota bacterium]